MPKNTTIELPDDLAEAVTASGRSVADLIRAGLAAADAGPEDDKSEQEAWLAGVVAELINKLNDGYVLVPRKQ
jgi:predicted transcriptional regulator